MKISENILYNLSKRWASPVQYRSDKLGKDVDSVEYNINYALKEQYDSRARNGMGFSFRGKSLLEIGCGHGGVSTFLAMNGAKRVIGIDLNTINLDYARQVKKIIEGNYKVAKPLNLEFLEMSAYDMAFEDGSFDIVVADNVFEHFMEPQKVMEQSFKVLKPGGILAVPKFSSILSKHALHLKQGLKVPWANLFFSEKTICNVMVKLSKEKPELVSIYPGVVHSPQRVRDLRRYKDLNDITCHSFKKMACDVGFTVKEFKVSPTPYVLGKIIKKTPLINRTRLIDIFSIYASSVLLKP